MDNCKAIIEIGSFSIKTIIYSEYNDKHQIIGTGKSNTKGFTGNEIENFDDFIDCIKNSIVQAEKQANYIIKDTYLLITNRSINIKKIKKDLILDGPIIEKNDVRKISKINLSKNEKFYQNIYTSHFLIDDNLVTDHPIGLNSQKLSIISLLTSIDYKQINFLKNIFQKLQIKILNYLDSTTSYFFYLKYKKISKSNLILIDFGFNHTNVIMIKNKQLSFVKKIPYGCKLISDDLVKMLNISFDFAEKLKISTIDLLDTRNSSIEIPVWEEFGNNVKNKIEHNYIKKIVLSRIDEILKIVMESLPKDKNYYSYLFTGGGSKIKNFGNYFRSRYGHDIQFLEPPKSCGIPKVLNDASIMSLYSSFLLLTHKNSENINLIKKNDSFSNKIWYKRFVDLL